jgi:hypothetical protein
LPFNPELASIFPAMVIPPGPVKLISPPLPGAVRAVILLIRILFLPPIVFNEPKDVIEITPVAALQVSDILPAAIYVVKAVEFEPDGVVVIEELIVIFPLVLVKIISADLKVSFPDANVVVKFILEFTIILLVALTLNFLSDVSELVDVIAPENVTIPVPVQVNTEELTVVIVT